MGTDIYVYFYSTPLNERGYLELLDMLASDGKWKFHSQFNKAYEERDGTDLSFEEVKEEITDYFSREDRFSITVEPPTDTVPLRVTLVEDMAPSFSIETHDQHLEDEANKEKFVGTLVEIFRAVDAEYAALLEEHRHATPGEDFKETVGEYTLELMEDRKLVEKVRDEKYVSETDGVFVTEDREKSSPLL